MRNSDGNCRKGETKYHGYCLDKNEEIIHRVMVDGYGAWYGLGEDDFEPADMLNAIRDTKSCILTYPTRKGHDAYSEDDWSKAQYSKDDLSYGVESECGNDAFFSSVFPYGKIDRKLYDELSDIIKGRTSYGTRAPEEGSSWLFSWSNGSKSWGIWDTESVRYVDANQFQVPKSYFGTIEEARRMARVLPPLPLYFASHEAGERGEVSIPQKYRIFLRGNRDRVGASEELKALIDEGLAVAPDEEIRIPDTRGELEKRGYK